MKTKTGSRREGYKVIERPEPEREDTHQDQTYPLVPKTPYKRPADKTWEER